MAAGLLFVLPGLLVMLGLSALYVVHGRSEWAGPVLLGLKAAVIALVAQALARISRRVVRDRAGLIVAILAFALLTFTILPFPLLILAAGLAGWLLDGGAAVEAPPMMEGGRSTLRTMLVCLALWLAPVAAAWIVAPQSILARMGALFSGLAVVSFGGAYAALAYLGQATSAFGWLTPDQMLDGLGLAETTPGPLVLVFTFVGFVGAFQAASPPWAWIAGLAGGLMAAWTTFAPSFLWIFAGGPFFERLRAQARPARALAMVSAASVGVIGQLAIWFAVHFLFGSSKTWRGGVLKVSLPELASLNPAAVGLTGLALVLAIFLRLPVLALVAVMVGAGLALKIVGFG